MPVEEKSAHIGKESELSSEELSGLLSAGKYSAVYLQPNLAEKKTSSFIGGRPRLPKRVDWPYFQCGEFPQIPMRFVAEIGLAELAEVLPSQMYTSNGSILIFWEPLIAPIYDFPTGSAKAFFVPEGAARDNEAPVPVDPDLGHMRDALEAYAWWFAGVEEADFYERPPLSYRQKPVSFKILELCDPLFVDNRFYGQAARRENLKTFDSVAAPENSDSVAINTLFEKVRTVPDDHVSVLTLQSDPDTGFGFAECAPIVFSCPKNSNGILDFSEITVTIGTL